MCGLSPKDIACVLSHTSSLSYDACRDNPASVSGVDSCIYEEDGFVNERRKTYIGYTNSRASS